MTKRIVPLVLLLSAAIAFLFLLLAPTAKGQEEFLCYEGCPPPGQEVQEYSLFVGKWSHTCITFHATDPLLASLTAQSLDFVWGSVSPLRSCGNVQTGEDITVMPVPTGSLGSGILGQAFCGGSGGVINHCNVSIADNGRFLGVVAHEIGHSVGLGHAQRSDQLMSAFCCHELNFDDIAGIQFLYGPGTGTPAPRTPSPTIPTESPFTPCSGIGCITRTPAPTVTPTPPLCVIIWEDTPDGTSNPIEHCTYPFRLFVPGLARN